MPSIGDLSIVDRFRLGGAMAAEFEAADLGDARLTDRLQLIAERFGRAPGKSIPAAYDLVCVEANLSCDPWSVHPGTPNRNRLVRQRLLEGYQDVGESAVIDQFQEHHIAYKLVALLRAMNHLDSMTEFVMPNATEKQVDATAQEYRKMVTDLLA